MRFVAVCLPCDHCHARTRKDNRTTEKTDCGDGIRNHVGSILTSLTGGMRDREQQKSSDTPLYG